MATFSADQMIDKTLLAKENLIAFYGAPNSKSIFQIFKGQNAGKVFSWTNKNTPKGQLYWEFMDSNNRPYFILHDSNKLGMSLTDQASTLSDQEKAKQLADDLKKKTQGAIPYYIDKYGKPVLLIGLGLGILKILYDGRNKS